MPQEVRIWETVDCNKLNELNQEVLESDERVEHWLEFRRRNMNSQAQEDKNGE
jgi:hypothetical protein